ncbi:MAG: APC family permease [Nocardioidaceae bacterium]|nr:MAG: APC family permease [Nocardioidaceae bacterium]
MGVTSMVFFVVAASAPLSVVVALGPLTYGLGNPGVPILFLVAAVILLLFSVGYAAMSRFISGPGGFAVYASRAFGPSFGGATAAVATVSYYGVLGAIYGLFGALAQPVFADMAGLDLDWWVWALLAAVVVGFLGYRSVDVSAKVLGVVLVVEILLVLILDIAILIDGGSHGINFDGFNPSHITGSGANIVLLLAFASWLGFEATTLYGEEAKDRHVTVPRATYGAVILIGVFYVFTFWAIGIANGDDTAQVALDSPTTMVFDLGRQYLGSFASDVMQWLVLASVFACLLAFHNSLSRYMFALGRNGLMPSAMGRSHKRHQAPSNASLLISSFAVVVIAFFALIGKDPYLNLYAWFIGVGTIGALCLYLIASASVIRYLWMLGTDRRLWQALIAPILALLGLGMALYLALDQFDLLTASTNTVVNLLWLLPPLAAVIGFIVAHRWFRDKPADAFEQGLAADLDVPLSTEATLPDA